MESLAKKIYKVSHLRGKFKLRSGKNSICLNHSLK